MVDNSDEQYASFRDNVPNLFIVMALHPLLRRVYDNLMLSRSSRSQSSKLAVHDRDRSYAPENSAADERLNGRISFDVGFSLIFLSALHGFSAIKVLLILYINYNLATRLKRNYVPILTWVFNIGILFANEFGRGYPFSTIAALVSPWSASSEGPAEHNLKSNWGDVLDSYGGLIPRWEILFNVTVLRLVSFNFDYYWSLSQASGSSIEVCNRSVSQP